ncbi:lysylphosphatidylglycerol synthase domain-containing protein [Bacteroidota bacterium]
MIYTWVGFVVSAIPTLIFYGIQWLSIALLLIVIALTLFLFVAPVHNFFLKLLKKLSRIEFDLPVISFQQSVPIIISTSMIWICWTLSFYFFINIFESNIAPILAFAFPLSVCFGLIAIILPGGLGLREGIIVAYLVLAGIDIEIATSIAFLNRIAFISGEGFIFLLALVIRL